MLKIFHAPRTRSLRVVWLCEEMGVPYEVSLVEFGKKSRAFVAANPSGTLPTIVDGDAVLTESVAILQYICGRYGPTLFAVGPEAPNYADYLQALVLGEAGLAAPLNAMVGCRFYGKPEDLETFPVKVITEGFLRRLKLVDRQLAKGLYMAGDAFTAADISVSYAIGIGLWLDLGDGISTPVKDYHRRMTERPAYQRAAAVG